MQNIKKTDTHSVAVPTAAKIDRAESSPWACDGSQMSISYTMYEYTQVCAEECGLGTACVVIGRRRQCFSRTRRFKVFAIHVVVFMHNWPVQHVGFNIMYI